RAVPEKGKANAALEDLIAEWIGAPRRSVSVTSGETSRLKTVFVSGAPDELTTRITELADQS
ncbi:MAG: DUF167 domain-containing protein, partial [Rhizobiaceae bacterium]|nr:DUF167 domain-containing protein [Rhizobiaceae bacterium]